MSAQDLPVELRRRLASIARTPRLLVTSDYDGTMAPIVSDPSKAFPHAEAVRALRALATLPGTTSAVISGRALRDLAVLSRLPVEVQLVGSHGSEFDVGFVHEIDDDARRLLRELTVELQSIAADSAGVAVELKPASAALHVRNAAPEVAEAALTRARTGPAKWNGVHVTEGKAVIELAVIVTDKGEALDILRHREGASAAVFLGDDVTDEKAFRRLRDGDVGVKVGPGETLATYRVDEPEDVGAALKYLLDARR